MTDAVLKLSTSIPVVGNGCALCPFFQDARVRRCEIEGTLKARHDERPEGCPLKGRSLVVYLAEDHPPVGYGVFALEKP